MINPNEDEREEKRLLKRRIKINIFDTLTKVIPVKSPWGILTGIRPVKIVHELLDKGENIEEIRINLKENYRIADKKIDLLINVALRERKYIQDLNGDLVSIYIGIPFCPTRCVYCSFPSNPVDNLNNKVEKYLDALLIEIIETGKILRELNKKIETIYIGGGTPTTLTSKQLDKLIYAVLSNFDISTLKEFTVEAGRPDTITKEKLEVMKKHGVDRISINPQTMNDHTLKIIGRNHTVEDIKKAYYEARNIGFKTINMDIIVGLPNEGLNEIKDTMDKIIELNPENLTVHTLAVKRSSKLKENIDEYSLTQYDLANKMLELTQRYAYKIGLTPYYMYRQKHMVGNLENIGYSKEGHENIYNIQIMEERQSIIALGAGAISKIVYLNENRLERVPNVKNVDEYINRVYEMVDRKKKELL